MNKLLIKGAIAGAAGIALLTGGAGTFALWSSSAEVEAGSITSGTLSISAEGNTATWEDLTNGTPEAIADIAAHRISPGDVVQLTQVVSIEASGDNLEAELSFDVRSVGTDDELDSALANALTYTFEATGENVERKADTDIFLVKPAATSTTTTVTLVATITFPAEILGAANGTVDLSKIAVHLKQTV